MSAIHFSIAFFGLLLAVVRGKTMAVCYDPMERNWMIDPYELTQQADTAARGT